MDKDWEKLVKFFKKMSIEALEDMKDELYKKCRWQNSGYGLEPTNPRAFDKFTACEQAIEQLELEEKTKRTFELVSKYFSKLVKKLFKEYGNKFSNPYDLINFLTKKGVKKFTVKNDSYSFLRKVEFNFNPKHLRDRLEHKDDVWVEAWFGTNPNLTNMFVSLYEKEKRK